MIVGALEQLFKLLNGKNISYSVLLSITIMCGYFVFVVVDRVMQDNTVLINSLKTLEYSLSKILETIQEHERHEQIRNSNYYPNSNK